MLETFFWPVTISSIAFIFLWQFESVARFFKTIVCPKCKHVFPVPTRSMPRAETDKLVGEYGYRCPNCACESDHRGIELTAESPPLISTYHTYLRWGFIAFGLAAAVSAIALLRADEPAAPQTDEISEVTLLLPVRPAPLATHIDNARDEVRARLVLHQHILLPEKDVYTVGVEFENLSIGKYARIEFHSDDVKLELLDRAGLLVPRLPGIQSGPAPQTQVAIIPPGSCVVFSTHYPGVGLHTGPKRLSAGDQAWQLKSGTYRLRGTVAATIQLESVRFDETQRGTALPPETWPESTSKEQLDLHVSGFSIL